MTFGSPDRPAAGDSFDYDSTRERWEREGLPAGMDPNEYFNMDFNVRWEVPVKIGVLPSYDEEILEETEEYIVERRSSGETVRRFKHMPEPAMPQWIKYPLQSRADWEEYKRRLDPDTPERFPANFAELAAEWRDRDYPLGIWMWGAYGIIRDWWGLQRISVLFYDEPALIAEMVEHLTYFCLRFLDRVLAYGVEFDWIVFWEDLAYKAGPLLSPALYRKYCLPFYVKLVEKVQAAGIPVVIVDSDGDVRQIIPMWLETGVTAVYPMEVASNMDVGELRRQYGRQLGFHGGIDKRSLAGSREEIRREVVPKLEACFEEGGFIPACDHAVPPDISFDNYRYFRDLVRGVGDRVYGT